MEQSVGILSRNTPFGLARGPKEGSRGVGWYVYSCMIDSAHRFLSPAYRPSHRITEEGVAEKNASILLFVDETVLIVSGSGGGRGTGTHTHRHTRIF